MKKSFFKSIYMFIGSMLIAMSAYSCDQALKAIIDQRSMALVRKLQQNPKCQTHAKLATWLALKENFKSIQFSDYQKFIKHNPAWPRRKILIRKAENISTQALPDPVIKWFKEYPPQTGAGALSYLNACHSNLHQPLSNQQLSRLRQLWIHIPFSSDEETEFLELYQHWLKPVDHRNKVARLLDKGDTVAAVRLCHLLPADYQAVVSARVAFMTHQHDAEAKLAYVSPAYSNDYNLLLDHLHWLRQRKHPHTIEFLYKYRSQMLNNPEKLWKETYILIRQLLEDNNYKQAMQLVSGHGLKPGLDYSEAEWLRGWLVLKLLKNALLAKKIFQHLTTVVTTPVSLAKMAYWTAIASQICEPQTANTWFKKAARYPTTFYGQLSLKYLKQSPKLLSMALPNPKIQQQFNNRELVKVLTVLKINGLNDYYRTFLYTLFENVPPSEKILVVQLTKRIDPDYVVSLARCIPVTDNIIIEDSYPILATSVLKNAVDVDTALLHAVIRKESIFDRYAVSPAGAIGLMQVMPDTARIILKSLQKESKRPFNLTDPNFNVYLGSTYLARQLQKFDGSVVLALSAYNAGPVPASKWLQCFGDPRSKNVDLINWIEMIPFRETRNYVQRVIENQGVYQILLNQRKKINVRAQVSKEKQNLKSVKKIVKRKAGR